MRTADHRPAATPAPRLAPVAASERLTEVVRAGRVGVVAVIVTYQVDPVALDQLLGLLGLEADAAVVVDNGSAGWADPTAALPVQAIRLPDNQGLAAAQNIGLQVARLAGAAHILLLDQDSRPVPGMVGALLAAMHDARRSGCRVAAAGPLVLDENERSEGFVRFRDGRYRAVVPDPAQSWLECDMLIASGSLIPVDALDEVGPMSEAFFIDKVDTEWCLRALAAGHRLLGVPAAQLHHRLGERTVRLWFGGWRELSLHKPLRYYYMVRNSLLLRRLPHASPAWRTADRRQLLSLWLYFGLLAPGRWSALRLMGRGLIDGLRGVDGPLR